MRRVVACFSCHEHMAVMVYLASGVSRGAPILGPQRPRLCLAADPYEGSARPCPWAGGVLSCVSCCTELPHFREESFGLIRYQRVVSLNNDMDICMNRDINVSSRVHIRLSIGTSIDICIDTHTGINTSTSASTNTAIILRVFIIQLISIFILLPAFVAGSVFIFLFVLC